MARKIPEGSVPVFIYLDPMAARPALAQRIGTICHEWSRVEQAIAMIFAALLDAPDQSLYEIEILERIESIRGKVSMVTALCEHRLDDAAELAIFRRDMDKVVALSRQRNKYIHGRWAIATDCPDELVLMSRIGPSAVADALLINTDDLDRFIGDLRRHSFRLVMSFRVVRPKLKPIPHGGGVDTE